MNDLTLESLARRVEALEKALSRQQSITLGNDWRCVVGMFRDSPVMRQIDAEGRAIREADREAARCEDDGG